METQEPQIGPRKPQDGLDIRLLGEIRVSRGVDVIVLPASKRTRALLGFLAATAKPQTRQTLCDFLWDGPDDPRAALRWSLTKLRPLLNDAESERLRADREHVSFCVCDATVDIDLIEKFLGGDPDRADLKNIEEAARLLRGEFLDGLDLPACYRFHHWCLAERERWGALRRRVLSIAIERLSDAPEQALPYARALVAADPLSESAHGGLVALLATLGRRKDAQDYYVHARDLLRRELGAPLVGELRPPSALRARTAATPKAHEDIASPELDERPLIGPDAGLFGREMEKDAIESALDALVLGAVSKGILFTGEAGIGKSRLLNRVAKQAELRGARVVAARCFEAEAVRPYGCWADALSPLIEGRSDAAQYRDLAVFLPFGELPVSDDGSRTRVFTAVFNLLSSIAAEGPLVLIIDDMQWIDESSSSLLHYVLRAWTMPGAFLFGGSARADEIDDNPWCKRIISSLTQDGSIERVELKPLQASDAARFFTPGTDPGEVSAALRDSGGNPLYLTEIANARRDGQSNVGRDLDTLIGDRIARLDDNERDLIVFASATTRDFKPELLGAAMDVPEARLIERFDRLERRGLLKPGGDGRFDFAHDLIRQSIYRGLSQPRRRLIHRRLARALEDAARRDQMLTGEFAYHAGAAGDHRLAVEASIAAGEHCLRVFANAAAFDAADRGLGHLQHLSNGPDRARWHIALLKIKVFAGASPGIRAKPDVSDELQEAVETAELLGLHDHDAAFGWHMASWSAQRSNDTTGAEQAILRAEELTRPLDKLTRCQQLANTGRCLLEVESEIPRARDFLNDAQDLAVGLGQSFVELDWGHGLVARWDGDLATARQRMRRALALARLREDRWREIECLVWLAKIALESRNFDEIESSCEEIDAIARRIGDGSAPVADAIRAVAGMLLGSEAPESHLRFVLDAMRALDDKAQLAYILNQIAMCRLAKGDLKDSLAKSIEALEAARAVRRTTEIVVASSLIASIRARSGELRSAKDAIAEIHELCVEKSHLSARARVFLENVTGTPEIPTQAPTALS